MAKDKTIIGVKFDPEDRERVERQAEREHRSMSSLICSIVLLEIERRERRHQQNDRRGAAEMSTA